ncbi:DUF2790 domain-containing protein [Pseudomonas sp. NCCP-436]|uniref:DUF2790 domain-containing protein n=1 Tax=Pseudomonas sp. NCCP-436 TaxID=2842481 RepID=UPI001C806239|nr:DUF2790 domain-containing protein [Pseudomonas sp. NCCP-436]GIZ11188.1 hypothetical protein NCCP436_06040 [Pseudomonas sp. NCCP-436]
MKIRALLATVIALLTLGSGLAQAKGTDYSYGQKLDIAQLIAIQVPDTDHCEIVRAKMIYRDSAGHLQTLNFRQLADACSRQN